MVVVDGRPVVMKYINLSINSDAVFFGIIVRNQACVLTCLYSCPEEGSCWESCLVTKVTCGAEAQQQVSDNWRM